MKIAFQNPTLGPLITVSFEDVDGTAYAFVPAVADCAAKSVSRGSIATGSSAVSVAGPLALVGMLFAAGDTPQQEPEPTPIQPTLSPDQLRCLSNPYDGSAECALTRSILTWMPFQKNNNANLNAARASASDAGAHAQPTPAGIDLATPVTATDAQGTLPTSASVAAILRQQPSVSPRRPFQPGHIYNLAEIAAGQLHYPRLEALIDHLVAGHAHPMIVERGSGRHGALAVTVARKHPITIIEKSHQMPDLSGLPKAVRNNIALIDQMRAPQIPWADLVIWIHPTPSIMATDDVLDLEYMGQDVAPGGYLVIQTEITQYFIPETPEWKVLFSDTTMGFLAPSDFANWTGQNMGRTIVLQRQNTAPLLWHQLAHRKPDEFNQQARAVIATALTELRDHLERSTPIPRIAAWYRMTIMPQLEPIAAAFKTDFPKTPSRERHNLARDLMQVVDAIPVYLEAGDIPRLWEATDVVCATQSLLKDIEGESGTK